MVKSVLLGLSTAFAATLFFTSATHAQPVHARPGSALIFPLFDSSEGNNTLITVTNTNQSERSCGNGFREGDISIHYVYIDGATWLESNRSEDLTPADTITVFARGHNPNQETGFLSIEARDPETDFPVDYDHLIGSAIVVNSEFDFEWSYTPYAFEGIPNGNPAFGQDDCQRPFTDTPGSGDFNTIDFNGTTEYSTFPDTIFLDMYFGEGTSDARPGVTFSNNLVLMATSPRDTDVNLLGWNNNERRFSRTFRFSCWTSTTLGELTNAVTQENLAIDANPDELRGVSTGWLQMKTETEDSALLGVFSQSAVIGGEVFTAGRELQYSGSRVTSLPRL